MRVIERFLNKIKISGVNFYDGTACWEYTGSKHKYGYGHFTIRSKIIRSHRFLYEYYHGQIDPELVIHHKCYNPPCCNVLHLKQVTHKENILDIDSHVPTAINSRKTHCNRGHELSGDNLYLYTTGSRICKTCRAIHVRNWYQNHKENCKLRSTEYIQKNRDKVNRRRRKLWKLKKIEKLLLS